MAPIKTISVAMCTYNGEAFLKEQLDSILAQTFSPCELIVCDDCSQDHTLAILYAFRDVCSFPLKIIANDQNIGINKNFENAIAHCSGELIAFSDQDDIWQPKKLEDIVNAFQNSLGCGYVFSNADLVDEDGVYLRRNLWQSIGFNQSRFNKYTTGNQLDVMLKGGHFIYGMTMAFRSKFRQILLPVESRLFTACTHDIWTSLILSAIGAYGVPIKKSLVMYRQHDKQIAGGGRRLSFRDYLTNMRTHNTEIDLAYAEALENIALRLSSADQNGEYELHARKQLAEKALHIRARSLANTSKGFQKLKIIYFETISGRYGQFSGSYKSILKDLIL